MNSVRKKPFFNVKLYLEGIRQLRVVGVMGAIIMGGAAFLIPMGYNISNANYEEYLDGRWTKVGNYIGTYGILDINPLIVTMFLILTPLMVMVLFNFLNRRNACDFYHAVPDTRTSLFLSYGASVLTWDIAILLLSYIITALSGAAFKHVQVDYSDILVVTVNYIAGCVFMFGVFAISMSLTGTILTNFLVAVMILAVPRIIVTVFMLVLSDSLEILPFTFSNSILDDRLNTVTNLVTGSAVRGDYDAIFMWRSALYTFVVGGLYCCLGLFLFRKRKSEAAASAAVNPIMQCVFRLVPAVLISLVPLATCISYFIQKYDMDGIEIFGIVVLYLIAILFYFIYELVTTKKLKNCLKAIPGLLGLVAFNVIFFGLFLASYHIVLNHVPKVLDIKYVHIDFDPYGYVGNFYSGKAEQADITSEEIKELLVSGLQNNIERIKSGDYSWYGERTVVQAEFHTKFGTITRLITLPKRKSTTLAGLLSQNPQIMENLLEPVPFDDIRSISGYRYVELTKEEVYDIYLRYLEELKTWDTQKCFNRLVLGSEEERVTDIRCWVKGSEMFNIALGTATPRTLNYYMNLVNSKNNLSASLILKECMDNELWKTGSTKDGYYREINLEMEVYPQDGSNTESFTLRGSAQSRSNGDTEASSVYGKLDLSNEEIRRVFSDVIKRLDGADTIPENAAGNVLQIIYLDEGKDATKDYMKYCIIDDATMRLLKALAY